MFTHKQQEEVADGAGKGMEDCCGGERGGEEVPSKMLSW